MKTSISLFKMVILVLTFTGISGISFGQWQQIQGLYGEPVYWVRGNNSKLFAMTSAGVLKSDNNGTSWTKVPELYLTNVIERMSASGDTIVMYAQPENYISTDNGATWLEITPPPGFVFASDIIVEQGKVYLPTYGDYLYTTIDGGVSWNNITAGLTTSEISCISAEGSTVFVGTDDGVFKSTNSGTSFTFSGLPGEYINKVYNKAPYVFAYGSGVFRSDDNGATWAPFEPVIPYGDITDFLVDGNKVYAATGGELITSNVFLPNWLPVNFVQDIDYNFSICKHNSSLVAGSNRGVFISNDFGLTWSESNTGIIPVSIRALTLLNNDTVFAGASIHGISHYDGTSWNYNGLGLLNSNHMISEGNDIYSTSEFGIHKSSDAGQTWEILNNNSPGGPVISFAAKMTVSDSLVLAGALQNGILRSGDFGVSWSTQSTGIAPSLASCVAVIGNNIIAGTYDNGLFLSTDAGFTWAQTGAVGELINDITVTGNVVIAATGGIGGTYRSTNQGLSWTPVASDYFEYLSVSGPYVIASGPGTVYLSVDQGLTYAFPTPAPSGSFISSSVASDNEVYIGTFYDGVWKTTFFDITGIQETAGNPFIASVVPNPAHDFTTIVTNDEMLQHNPVGIITDINGRKVKNQKIAGSFTGLDVSELKPGVYLFRVLGSNGAETTPQKIVIY